MAKTFSQSFYNLAWRWHFYAGLLVAPFMILLAITGIIYLFKPQLDPLLYRELMVVTPQQQTLSADALWQSVQAANPDAKLEKYLPPPAPDRSALFVVSVQGRETNLFVDPYRGQVLGVQDAHNNLQAIARELHGELMVGTVGDRLIELAAGWGIVLVVSGLYLWWPRERGFGALFWPRQGAQGRVFWRDLHAVTGFWGALLLLLMLMTGMTWTGYWGEQFANVWNRFPDAMWNDVPKSNQLARSLNQGPLQTVAWGMETTPLPVSTLPSASEGHHHPAATSEAEANALAVAPIPLQHVVDIAQARQVVPGYSISIPKGAEGVYSISVFADDPRNDAMVHVDQYSGQVLADVRWKDYGAVAKSVELGVMLHEGKFFGVANQLLMLLVCLMVILSAASGLVIWWKRRPSGRLGVPPMPHSLPLWKGGVAIMIVLGVLFPLVGLSLVLVWLLDWLLLSRLPLTRRLLAKES